MARFETPDGRFRAESISLIPPGETRSREVFRVTDYGYHVADVRDLGELADVVPVDDLVEVSVTERLTAPEVAS